MWLPLGLRMDGGTRSLLELKIDATTPLTLSAKLVPPIVTLTIGFGYPDMLWHNYEKYIKRAGTDAGFELTR
jgi:hypothetical protein